MSIYLGEAGHIELRRRSINETLAFTLSADDIDVPAKRFSFDGINDEGLLLNGDRVEFKRIEGDIQLVDGVTGQDGITRYVHVDSVGGIRLYDTFDAAVNGGIANALALVAPTEDQQVQVSLQDVRYRCLAECTSYEVTTSRETVDLTVLGDEFRRNYGSGLISGQGQCTAFWDTGSTDEKEAAHYLIQLVQRLEMGAMFDARFYIRSQCATPIKSECLETSDDSAVWWEVSCIVTNASVTFEPSALLRASIQFVTTGAFQLKTGSPDGYLLQEDDGLILEEETSTPIGLDQAD